MTNELTQLCKDYWKLHARARKAEGVPDPETLGQINDIWEQMSEFEQDYVTWINSLYARKINIMDIKNQIKILARYLADKPVSDEELEQCKPSKQRWWNKEKRYTQLCALRAAMRGRLHFSPNSNLENLWGCYHIGGCDADSNYVPIDLAVQKTWVEEVAADFVK
jgi:hypothetical protein